MKALASAGYRPPEPPPAEEPSTVDTVGYVEHIAAPPARDRAVGVYPPDLTAPGYHVVEYTPRNGNGRVQAALMWDPALGAWIAFPGGQYDPSVLKQSALAAEYVGALQYGMPSFVSPDDRITSLSGVGNAIRTAATESELRAVFYRHFSLLFNASTADQALILTVFLERMLRLTEPQP